MVRQGPCAPAAFTQAYLRLGLSPRWGPPAWEAPSLMLVLAATARTCLAWPAQPSEVLESGSHFMFNCGSNAGSATYLLYNLKPSYLSSPGLNFSNLQNVNDMIKLSWGFSEKTMQIKKIGWPLTKVYAALRGLASSGCSSDVPSSPGSSSLAPLAQHLLWFFFLVVLITSRHNLVGSYVL